jgi:hypothetical protein
MKKLTKELLGLAGEYAVASELCKRGMYAQLTLAQHKRTDILVESEEKMLRIQVKAKQGKEWPSIAGPYSEDEILVLVDFQNKEENVRPDFYILDLDDRKPLLEEEKKRHPDAVIDDKLTIRYKDGWKGLNIRPDRVQDLKGAWGRIVSKLPKNT